MFFGGLNRGDNSLAEIFSEIFPKFDFMVKNEKKISEKIFKN
jgi:hypothetical protein